MADSVTKLTGTGATGEALDAPWKAEDFDPERAWTLVSNLRAERDELKKANAQLRTETARLAPFESRVGELENELEQVKQETGRITAERVKERLLTERGLPLELLDNLTGDDEDKWRASADLFKSYFVGKNEPEKPAPDPFQAESRKGLNAEALKDAQARQFFEALEKA